MKGKTAIIAAMLCLGIFIAILLNEIKLAVLLTLFTFIYLLVSNTLKQRAEDKRIEKNNEGNKFASKYGNLNANVNRVVDGNIKMQFKDRCIEIKHKLEKNNEGHVKESYVAEFTIAKYIQREVNVIYDFLGISDFVQGNVVPIDNTEFNKVYKILCDDKYLAVRLFTADVLTKIMELYEQYDKLITIKIRGSKIIMEHINRKYESSEEETFNIQTLKDKEDLVFIRKMVDILYTMIENFEE